jgi:hypothetical protein
LFVVATAVCAAAPLSSCLDATEIVIQLTTDVPCDTVAKTTALIRIGSPANIETSPPTRIESTTCATSDATTASPNDMGTVVIVPSSGFDSIVAISIALSDDATVPTSACLPEPQGTSCIYAHRQISFLPHARVTLPITLSSRCAGVVCMAPLTCGADGTCTDGTVDPHDCGTNCTTGDSGPDSPIKLDAAIDVLKDVTIDVPVDVTTCTGTAVMCNGQCVDLLSNTNNCGGCGVDCSGSGSCNAGTCAIDKTIVGTCLAVYGGKVWVATDTGVWQYAANGGSGVLYNSNTDYVFGMAGDANNVVWFANSGNQAYVWDVAAKQGHMEATNTAMTLMAFNSAGYAWFDQKGIGIVYQAATVSAPIAYTPTLPTTNPVPIAMGAKYVYVSTPGLGKIWYTNGSSYNSVSVTSPGAIIVDDSNSTTPAVFDVEGNTTVVQRDSTLKVVQTAYAKSSAPLASITWDGSTVVANSVTEMSIAIAGLFKPIVINTNAVLKCVAVDSNAVYWLDKAGGVYKHAK